MDNRARYITTTLPYVNADPHIGYAFEVVRADAFARHSRLVGKEVFFNIGTDEHGTKIQEKAREEGKDVQEYVDFFAGRFQELAQTLGISYTRFVRTTDESHKHAAKELWKLCLERGDIYKKKYKGLYCVGDEMFLRESDLVNGRCPNHPDTEPVEIEEENYFFALSKYAPFLEEYLEHADHLYPEWQRTWALEFVRKGLEDFSISREKERLSWGVEVPGDDMQVMYVWFEALTNYISTLGWPSSEEFVKFWEEGETFQFAGKDQVRFQSIIWQAMLKSAGLPATDTIIYHGFIQSGGQKMSKSLGNVINPIDVMSRVGKNGLRYYLLRHVHPSDDSDVTVEKIEEGYVAHLVNGLGNAVSRVLRMYLQYEAYADIRPLEEIYLSDDVAPFRKHMESFEFNKALDSIWKLVGEIDATIQEREPFKLVKTDEEAARAILKDLAEKLLLISAMLLPIMSETAESIYALLSERIMPEPLFPRLDS